MLKDSQAPRYAVRRTHRTYTPQFKVQLVAACMQPGASIAALALQHGMNANVLHRWCKEYRQGHHRQSPVRTAPDVQPQTTPAFMPIALNAVPPSCVGKQPVVVAAPSTLTGDIRIECQRLGVTVHWPVSAATECTQMLRELLR